MRCDNAMRCQRSRAEVDRHAECVLAKNSSDAARSDRAGAENAGGEPIDEPNRSQACLLRCRRCTTIGNAQSLRFATWGLAKTASVIDFITLAASSGTLLPVTYPSYPHHSNSAPWCLIRLQQRCNLDHRRVVRTHFFHRICNLARPVETPLCKIWFCSYTIRCITAAKQLYIQM